MVKARRPDLGRWNAQRGGSRSGANPSGEHREGRLWRAVSFLPPALRGTRLRPPDDAAEHAAEGRADAALSTRPGPDPAPSAPRTAGEQAPLALGPGEPLRRDQAEYFAPRFGSDLSDVRVHTDAAGAGLARALNADAFSVGSHVVFGSGRYAPEDGEGRRLLAHEIAHVVQERQSPGPPAVHRKVAATRFTGEPTLDDISEGKKVLKEGDKG